MKYCISAGAQWWIKYYISAFGHENLLNKQHVCSNDEILYFIHPNLPITIQLKNDTNPNPTIILLQQKPVRCWQVVPPVTHNAHYESAEYYIYASKSNLFFATNIVFCSSYVAKRVQKQQAASPMEWNNRLAHSLSYLMSYSCSATLISYKGNEISHLSHLVLEIWRRTDDRHDDRYGRLLHLQCVSQTKLTCIWRTANVDDKNDTHRS